MSWFKKEDEFDNIYKWDTDAVIDVRLCNNIGWKHPNYYIYLNNQAVSKNSHIYKMIIKNKIVTLYAYTTDIFNNIKLTNEKLTTRTAKYDLDYYICNKDYTKCNIYLKSKNEQTKTTKKRK